MRFTERTLVALLATGKRYERTDSAHKGLIIRVSDTGRRTFCYKYTINGRRRRLTLGVHPAVSLAEVLVDYERARMLVLRGSDPASKQELVEQKTVKHLADEYMEHWAKPRKRSWREDQRILNHDILPQWGERAATDICRRDVVGLLDAMAGRAPQMANKLRALIVKQR